MRRLALILTLTVTSAAAIAAPTAAQNDGYTDPFAWKKCRHMVDSNLKITAARNMRCKAARRVMSRYHGQISRRFQAGGFTCRLVKGRPISGIWSCKKGRKAFRFASTTSAAVRQAPARAHLPRGVAAGLTVDHRGRGVEAGDGNRTPSPASG